MNSTTPTPQVHTAAASSIDASKFYGKGDSEVRALDGVTVEFRSGEFTAIMGPSGSGKSTLMHCLAGLDSLTAGKAFIGDVDLSSLNERQLTHVRREQVGFVFQAFNLIPTLTARENIELPLDLGDTDPDAQWVDKVIDAVGLRDRLDHKPAELSGGQQQRVAVARALASKPKIIFADEPTGNLDSATGRDIADLMFELNREHGTTLILVTHDEGLSRRCARRLRLASGQLVADERG